MSISIKDKFGSDIQHIFDDERFKEIDLVKRGFLSSEVISFNSVLFVGLNPSYVDNTPTNSVNYYSLTQEGNEYKQYFSKFEEIAESSNLPLAHIDLLFLRETEQKKIDQILAEKNGVDFVMNQLQVSKQILEMAKPKVLIVSNTKARQFLGKDKNKNINIWMGYDFEFDDSIGTDRIVNKGSTLKGIPVFFTSMLSGQRALDKGSYERLSWHIKFALNGGMK